MVVHQPSASPITKSINNYEFIFHNKKQMNVSDLVKMYLDHLRRSFG